MAPKRRGEPLPKRLLDSAKKAAGWTARNWKPAVTVAAPVLYMLVFQVTPLDTYFEIRDKRNLVRFHDGMGLELLKRGSYARSQEEYRLALDLDSKDHEGMIGSYLAGLFMGLDSASLDPAISIAIERHLDDLGITRKSGLWESALGSLSSLGLRFRDGDLSGYRKVVAKYLADLESRVGDPQRADRLYDSVLALDSAYLDALYAKGWRCYDKGKQSGQADGNLDTMLTLFRRMARADSFDFRGLHGYGYALYMRAVNGNDRNILETAAEQSSRAARLSSINRLNVVMDFGEIARALNPDLALLLHKDMAAPLLADSTLGALPWNKAVFNVCLLTKPERCLYLENAARKQAWLRYQLALDYEARRRQNPARDSAKRAGIRKAEDKAFSEASALDKDPLNPVREVYDDQLSVLNRFLPAGMQ